MASDGWEHTIKVDTFLHLESFNSFMFPVFTLLLTAFPPLLRHVASNLLDTTCPVVTQPLKASHCLCPDALGVAQLCLGTEQAT